MVAPVAIIGGVVVMLVWVGSRSYFIGKIVACIVGSMAVGVAAGLACDALGLPRYEWQAPFLVIIPLPVLAVYLAWLSDCEPVTVAGVVRVVRQRVAVRATVRRRVQQYQVEVQ